jgi:anaerobic magnesium-protoporphyrin IX monomethyl ester cyclase
MRNPYVLPPRPRYTIVLVNLPSTEIRNSYDYRRSVPPLGLGYIATYLEDRGLLPGILDAEVHQLNNEQIASILHDLQPDFVGVNCYSSGVSICRDLLRRLRGVGQRVFVGGPHVTAKPNEFWEFPYVTTVSGFGEDVLYKAIAEPPTKFPAYLSDFQLTEEIVEMQVNQRFFHNSLVENEGRKEGVLISSRGCPYSCKYCMSAETKYRLRSMQNTMQSIDGLVNGLGAETIHFLDDIVFPSNARLREFIDALREVGLYGRFTWRGLLSIGVLNKMDAELLTMSMCRGLSIGLESGSERMLQSVGKRYTMTDVIAVLDKIERTPIRLKLFFMIGLPTETLSDIEQSRAMIRRLRDYQCVREINIFQFKPYPGTALYNQYFTDEPVEFFFHDLRTTHGSKIISHDMEKAVVKDTYFCRHKLLGLPIDEMFDLIVEMYTDFYQARGLSTSTPQLEGVR